MIRWTDSATNPPPPEKGGERSLLFFLHSKKQKVYPFQKGGLSQVFKVTKRHSRNCMCLFDRPKYPLLQRVSEFFISLFFFPQKEKKKK
jgi:hypothetical protein